MLVLSVFKYIFPPPRYITLPNVGLDISDTSLKYMRLERTHVRDTNLSLISWGSVDIPEGAVERGVVKDVPKLAEVLKQIPKLCGTEYVRVSLPEERAYLFETTIQHKTSAKEIRGLLEFKLEENVPLSPRDAYFDYSIIDCNEAGDLLVSVAVYAKNTINNYYDACVEAGLMPLSFEVEAQAISRAVVGAKERDAYMLVDFGKTRTGIGIVYKNALMYTSTIDIGGNDLSRAMREKIGDLPEEEYSKIKNTKGLINTSDNEVYGELIEVIDGIKTEIKTRIQYWKNRGGVDVDRAIQKIILCGGSANLAGLTDYLYTELGIEAYQAQVWKNAFSLDEFVPPITKRYSYGYTTAVGLALRDFISYD